MELFYSSLTNQQYITLNTSRMPIICKYTKLKDTDYPRYIEVQRTYSLVATELPFKGSSIGDSGEVR